MYIHEAWAVTGAGTSGSPLQKAGPNETDRLQRAYEAGLVRLEVRPAWDARFSHDAYVQVRATGTATRGAVEASDHLAPHYLITTSK